MFNVVQIIIPDVLTIVLERTLGSIFFYCARTETKFFSNNSGFENTLFTRDTRSNSSKQILNCLPIPSSKNCR